MVCTRRFLSPPLPSLDMRVDLCSIQGSSEVILDIGKIERPVSMRTVVFMNALGFDDGT